VVTEPVLVVEQAGGVVIARFCRLDLLFLPLQILRCAAPYFYYTDFKK
jgi:hypothetical protein